MSDDDKKPFHNPFGALREKLGDLPPGPSPRAPAPLKGPARAVVRMERKGRGGKEVTVIEQLDLKPADLQIWLKHLKNALGCGGAIGRREELNAVGDDLDCTSPFPLFLP